MRKIYFLFALFLGMSSNLLFAQNTALSFSGDDYADLGNSTELDANKIKTIEAWVKFNDLTGAQEILSKSANSQGIELLIYGGNLAVYCMNAGNYAIINYPVNNLATGIWYHIAFSWDGTKENMNLYVNGKPVGSKTTGGDINISKLGNPGTFKIGQWSESADPRYFKGSIDEVRIWNIQRTAIQLKNGMYGNVPANTTGLVAYYHLNEGSGTNIANSTAVTGLNGNLIATGSVWLNPSPIQSSANALNFDGIDDYVTASPNTLYDFTTGTIECWVRPNGLVGNACILGIRGANGTNTRYSFHMSTGAIGLYNNTEYVAIPFVSTAGQWYHLAFVCTPGNTAVYVNGNPIGNINLGISSVTGSPLNIGMAAPATNFEPFKGSIDEIRIWNVARSQTEIRNNMAISLTGTESGLVANFDFNQGIPNGNNTGMRFAIDKTNNNNHATLNNFAYTTTSSNFVGTTSVLPVKLASFTAEKKQSSVQINWSTTYENNSSHFDVERSVNGTDFYKIASVKSVGNSNNLLQYSAEDRNPSSNKIYYRLKQVDVDGKFEYSSVVSLLWNENDKTTIVLAPNPLRTIMNVSIKNSNVNGSFIILGPQGNRLRVYPVQATSGDFNFKIERGDLPAGFYFYKLISKDNSELAGGKIFVQ